MFPPRQRHFVGCILDIMSQTLVGHDDEQSCESVRDYPCEFVPRDQHGSTFISRRSVSQTDSPSFLPPSSGAYEGVLLPCQLIQRWHIWPRERLTALFERPARPLASPSDRAYQARPSSNLGWRQRENLPMASRASRADRSALFETVTARAPAGSGQRAARTAELSSVTSP